MKMKYQNHCDFHVHSNFSEDGTISPETCIKRAIGLGLKAIAITDHMDFDWPDPNYTFLIDDVQKYMDTLLQLKEKYKGDIIIAAGIEIGLQPQVLDRCQKLLESQPFDFVIGSVHIVGREDPAFPKYYENKTREQAYLNYYNETLKLIKQFSNFDVLGHLDYMRRYTPFPYDKSDAEIGLPIIEEILTTLITSNRGIEYNTSAYRHVSNTGLPHPNILKLYHQLGGKILTTGSDGHREEHITYEFDRAYEEIQNQGFEYVTIFQNRKPIFLKIEQE